MGIFPLFQRIYHPSNLLGHNLLHMYPLGNLFFGGILPESDSFFNNL